ncbi:MAG TPA: hypothetical protein VFS32_03295 [Candidatus Limnocylindrales bacterium]|nr:hypothetical protein [Candidatus Limnocylindrales bacterium]
MTRRIPPRSAVAAGDPDLARLATVDLGASSIDPLGFGRALSLRDLARGLVPAAILPVVPERIAITDRLRTFVRRSR